MNSSDIHPSGSVCTIMVNSYSEQAAPDALFSFIALGINICEAYLRSFLLRGVWEEK